MRKWIIIFIAAGCFFYWKHYRKTTDAPMASLKTPAFRDLIKTTSCEGKTACFIVYVTPWCPACEQLSPYLLKIQEQTKRDQQYGIKMIIGQERKSGENERIAARYGGTAVIDQDLSLHHILNIKYYPTILLVSKDGIITERDNDALEIAFRRYQIQ